MASISLDVRGGDFATARRGGLQMEEIQFIADKLLEGVGVQALAKMTGRPVCEVTQVAASLPRGRRQGYKKPKPMVYFPFGTMPAAREIDRITREVAAEYCVTVSDLKGESRLRQYAWPRQAAMWLITQTGNYPSTQIGTHFGGRDHSTVFHAVARVNQRLDECLAQAGFRP